MRKVVSLIVPLVFLILLSGCGRILQPTRDDLVSANTSSNQIKVWDMTINLSNNDFSMWYETHILVDSLCSTREGKATVYYLETYFTQECSSVTTEQFAAKEWRGNWAETNLKSPTIQLDQWLERIAAGSGLYWKQPVIPAKLSEVLKDFSSEFYCLQLGRENVDWAALCDVCMDSTFGGENFWDDYSMGNVYLFFDVDTLEVGAIYITMTDSSHWYEVVIGIFDAETKPKITIQGTDLIQGTLSEEWEMNIG